MCSFPRRPAVALLLAVTLLAGACSTGGSEGSTGAVTLSVFWFGDQERAERTEAARLPEPIFTPSTKAPAGAHDAPISFEEVVATVGQETAEAIRDITLAVYRRGADLAAERGVLIADTKIELGRAPDGTLVLADEVLTPDSSRFWPADGYEPGHGQPSFDKQYVRDWASGSGWDKTPPAPALPDDVTARTRELYVDAYERITGEPFDAWLERSA